MEVLNNNSFCEALVRCNDNKNYKAVIAFARRADAKDFAEENLRAAEIERRFVNDDLEETERQIKEFINGNKG